MRNLFIFLIFSFSYLANGQDKATIDCIILQEAIETASFKKQFFICKYKGKEVSIIDTNRFFKECLLNEICERKVKVYDKVINLKNKNNIVIYKIDIKRNIYVIYFWQPYTNATLKLELRQKRNRIKIKVLGLGAF